MTSRSVIKSVLHNFLETYTSRYSDYNGFWIFGMLVEHLEKVYIDLLNPECSIDSPTPLIVAVKLATTKFNEQTYKSGLSLSCIHEANLDIEKTPRQRKTLVNNHLRAGYDVDFVAQAISDYGRRSVCKKTLCIAPHDPNIELRSTRS